MPPETPIAAPLPPVWATFRRFLPYLWPADAPALRRRVVIAMVLVALAKRVSDGLRDLDMVARFGGEEFVVVMPDAEPEIAMSVAERIRRGIADEPIAVTGNDGSLSVTVSIGVATTSDPLEPMDSLIGRADAALYQAKNEGRNRVVRAQPAAEPASAAVR